MTSADLLVEVEDALLQIERLLDVDRQTWLVEPRRQFTVERLWILAGNAAEYYRRSVGISGGISPWSVLYEFRNVLAHQTLSERRPARVWDESQGDLQQLPADVRTARSQT